ncbi:MAG: aminotransferase class IV [Vicinamibacterales bacterium]
MIDATVNVNGRISDARSAVVSVFDHGFLFGDGVYETLRTYNHRPFLLDRHLVRLRASAAAIGLPVPLSDDELADRINATMDAAGVPDERYVRVLHTRGVGDLSYNPAGCPEPTTVVIVRPHRENPPDVLRRGVAIIVSSVLRNHPQAIDPRIKSNNLLNNALAMQEAIRADADEALMRNHRGEVSECAQSNFFLVRHGEAVTPSLDAGLLEGVTRNFVFEVGAHIDVPVRAAVLRDADLAGADEAFITSTTREILPVTKIDGRSVGSGEPGPVTMALANAFRRRADELTRA